MFFSPLSIFSRSSSLQSPKKAAAVGWLANDCALCGAGCGGELLCEACAASLPRIGPACARCGLPLPSGGICGACLRDAPAFDGAVTAFAYGFPLDRLVQRFKYGGDLAIGGWLASALAQRVAHESRPQLLVAPPLTRARLRERGFNQALEVAKVV